MAEDDDRVVIENGKAVVSTRVTLAPSISQFSLKIRGSDALTIELRAKPRREHTYDPTENILSCCQVSEQQFPMTIEIYPPIDSSLERHHYNFEIIENRSKQILVSMEVMDYE